MSRKTKFTQQQFMLAYKAAVSMKDLQKKLNCSPATPYLYCNRLGLPPLKNQDPAAKVFVPKHNPVVLARRYCYQITLPRLAAELHMQTCNLKYYLRMLVQQPKRFYLTKKLPPPLHIQHIKIINYLIRHPLNEKDTNPKELTTALGIHDTHLKSYWEEATGIAYDSYPDVKERKQKKDNPEEILKRNLERLKNENHHPQAKPVNRHSS
jgi:hypothetical protein